MATLRVALGEPDIDLNNVAIGEALEELAGDLAIAALGAVLSATYGNLGSRRRK